MKILEIIKSWYLGSDKYKIQHFNIDKIEDTIKIIRDDPFLKFMQTGIESLLENISISSKEYKGKEFKFLVINGVSGSGKTNFVYILKDFLIATGVIKKDQQRNIDKIAAHDLRDIGLRGKKAENVVAEKKINCKDGILILDEFTTKDKNSQLISDLIKQLYNDNSFIYTSVILMGEFRNNSDFIKTYHLEDIFKYDFRLNFYTPSADQIVDIFGEYVKREGYYTLTEKAISSLIFYFSKIKTVKETKFKLNKIGTLTFKYSERTYSYTSEMFPIYKEIVAIKDINSEVIDQKDILETNLYKKLLVDFENLKEYVR